MTPEFAHAFYYWSGVGFWAALAVIGLVTVINAVGERSGL